MRHIHSTRARARTRVALAALAAALLLASCRFDPPPDEPPAIEGTIVSVTETADGARVRIDEEPGPINETGGAKIVFDIDDRTPIFLRMEDGTLRRAPATVLREGQRARAWHTGLVRESHPAQAEARAIVLVHPGQ